MDWKFFLGMGGVLPSELDAVGGPGLGAPALLDVAGGRHHVLHRPVVVQVELMDHVLSILDNSHLGMTGTLPKMPTKQGLVFGIALKFRRSLVPGFPSVGSFIIPNFAALLPSFGVIQMCQFGPTACPGGSKLGYLGKFGIFLLKSWLKFLPKSTHDYSEQEHGELLSMGFHPPCPHWDVGSLHSSLRDINGSVFPMG